MKEEYRYLNDEELEALIADVEKNGMIAPPAYLKELIMEGAAQEMAVQSQEAELAKKHSEKRRELRIGRDSRSIKAGEDAMRRARIRFWIYSFKIAAAAAVAVFCLTAIPVDVAGEGFPEAGYMEERIEKDIQRYQQEKEKALADEEREDRGLRNLLDGRLGNGSGKNTDGIWNSLTDWFGMEE